MYETRRLLVALTRNEPAARNNWRKLASDSCVASDVTDNARDPYARLELRIVHLDTHTRVLELDLSGLCCRRRGTAARGARVDRECVYSSNVHVYVHVCMHMYTCMCMLCMHMWHW